MKKHVKSALPGSETRHPRRLRRIAASAAAVGLLAAWGGGADASQSGHFPRFTPLLAPAEPPACSPRYPLCVRRGSRVSGAQALAVLAAFERAWLAVTTAVRLPPPRPEPDRGSYDVLVEANIDGGASTFATARVGFGALDGASAATRVDARLSGCSLDATAVRELGRASLLGVTPSLDEGTAQALASYVSRLATPCIAHTTDGFERFQDEPERSLARVDDGGTTNAWAFFAWLDARIGVYPGAIVDGLAAVTATRTDARAWDWHREPDAYDVLRASLRGAVAAGSTFDDVLLEFACWRAEVGVDGATPTLGLGATQALPARIDWAIEWPRVPRRLASTVPLDPLGSTYLTVRTDRAPTGATLRIEASWEEHARLRMAVLKRDGAGRTIGRLIVPIRERGTDARLSVAELDGVASIAIVAVDTGDPYVAFDPDDGVFEPHRVLFSVAGE